MSKLFERKIEDFTCEYCGNEVVGDGYTNHCSKCLWSKHVDVNPGDRKANCGGLMRPIKVEKESGEYLLTHKCVSCGHEKRNKVGKGDDFDEVVKVVKVDN